MKTIRNLALAILTISISLACKNVDESQKADENYNQQNAAVYSKGPTSPSIVINNNDALTDSRDVSIKLSVKDNVGVTGYYIKEDNNTPSPSTSGWTVVESSSDFAVSVDYKLNMVDGSNDVYVWFKDIENNISAPATDSITNVFVISDISGKTSEDATSATFTVKLKKQPDGNVVISLKSSDTTEGDVSPDSLTFTVGNYSTPQTATVTGVDDAIFDGDQSYTIELTINAGSTHDTTGYKTLNPDDVTVVNSDTEVWKLPDTGQTTSDVTGDDGYYLIHPPSFTDNSNDVIADNNTGFTWQREDNNNTYTWSAAATYCASLSLNGKTDWRLPNRRELMGIANFGVSSPSINGTYFPNTNALDYWSSSTYAYNTSEAWSTDFNSGNVGNHNKNTSYHVRCVRGEQTATSFTNNNDGTVTDNKTHLIWRQRDDHTGHKWSKALTYCEDSTFDGKTDWRLPNIRELESIVDDSRHTPAINPTLFLDTYTSYYWSSTTNAGSTDNAWRIDFGNGYVSSYLKNSDSYRVRCVRGGQ